MRIISYLYKSYLFRILYKYYLKTDKEPNKLLIS